MKLWQLYIVTIALAVGSVMALFWFGALVQEARTASAKRMDCAIWSNRADPDDPRCPHK
jgi:hypothetical protein